MKMVITAAHLLTPTEIIDQPVLVIEDEKIVALGPQEQLAIPDGAHHHDFPGKILAPGFIDIHVHGGSGHDVMELDTSALAAIERGMFRHGVTSYLPTTVTSPLPDTMRSLENLGKAIRRSDSAPGRSRPIGIHLEGPFISHAKRGVHPPADILPPDIALFDRFQEAARGHVRLITIAPEMPGAIELIRHCSARGVRVSLGHTNAIAAEARAGIEAGASSATHTYNAMRALDHREPGVLGEVLDAETLFAEIICDGIHVVPELVRLWLKAKGPQR